MSLLVISNITIRMGGRTLMNGADLTVDPGRRIGLVGRNGAGKSTLLRAIAGEIASIGGDIRQSNRVSQQFLQVPPKSGYSLKSWKRSAPDLRS